MRPISIFAFCILTTASWMASSALAQTSMQPVSPENSMQKISPSSPGHSMQPLSPGNSIQSLSASSPKKTSAALQALAGWNVYHLGDYMVTDVSVGKSNTFSGRLSLDGVPPEKRPYVIGFRTGNSRPLLVALIYSHHGFADFLPSLRDTPAGDIVMRDTVVLIAPAASFGMQIRLPNRINDIDLPVIGGSVQKLNSPASIFSRVSIEGNTARFLRMAGAASNNLPLSGTIDLRMLMGKTPPRMLSLMPQGKTVVPTAEIEDQLIDSLDLAIPLGNNLNLGGSKPVFLEFGDSTLVFKGIKGRIAAGLSTSLAVNVGSGLRFDAVTINHNPVKQTLSIQSGAIMPSGNWLKLPVDNASITQMAFSGTIDERNKANDTFMLDGKYRLGSATPKSFSVTLTGDKSPAQYTVSLDADVTIGKLLGWSIPGLDDIGVTEVTAGSGFTSGNITLKGIKLPVVVFTGTGQGKPNLALLHKDISLSSLFPALKGLPLDDLHMKQSAWIMASGGNTDQPADTALPQPVSEHLGSPNRNLSMPLRPGINLGGTIALTGNIGKLLSGMGLRSASGSGTPEVGGTSSGSPSAPSLGSLPLDIFKSMSGGQLGQEAIDLIDLTIPLGSPNPVWKPQFLTIGDSTLVIKGVQGKVASGISTSLAVNVGNGLHFDAVAVNHDPVKQTLSIQSSGIKPTGNWLKLPVDNATITQLAFNATIDEQNRARSQFALKGQYTLASSKPEDFTVTLSGGSPAQYEVSLDVGMTLGQLLGWHPPGLDAIAIRNVEVASDHTSGTISLQGLDFTVMAFKAAGQASSSAAFIYDAPLSLPSLMSALNGTPLGDLELTNSGFVLSPRENGTRTVQFPAEVGRRLGFSSLELKPGLNLNARVRPLGELASLLGKLNLSSASLPPLTGTLDPSLFSSSAKALAKEFVAAIDLSLPLGKVAIPGAKQGVALNQGKIAIKGIDNGDGIDLAVKGNLAITAGGDTLSFDTSIRLEKDATGETLSLSGTYPSQWTRPLGIHWLNVSNVTLSGSIGQTNAIAVSGKTSIGNVHNLTIGLDLTEKPGQTTEIELDLMGADIPLSDIPGLSMIPNVKRFKLRDLSISNEAIGGTLKTDLALLKDARAVVFSSAGKWNLAVMLENLSLPQLLPLPGFAKPLLGKAKLEKLAFVLSEGGINSRVADLPHAASTEMTAIFGNPQGLLRIGSGVNLLSSLDPAKLSPAIAKMIPGGGKLALQGGINGIFGGAPSLNIAADIPPITMPPELKFVVMPENVQTAFFINLSEASVAMGVMIDAEIGARISGQTVTFDTDIAFELDTSGGVSVDLQGKTLSPWSNALGIQGFTMDTGTRIELKVSVTSEVTLTIVGKSHIGKKEVDLTGSASVLVAEGVIDKGAFEGKVSELGIDDLMALTNGVVAATGGAQMQNTMPVLKMANVDVAFASPGVSIPEMNLDGGGIRIAGDLWVLLKNQPLGRAFAQISPNGMIINGKMADFAVGPVAFKNNMLDSKAILMPPTPPYFKIHGGVDLFGKKQDAGLSLAVTEMEMEADLDLGKLMQFDFRASAGTPQGGLSPQQLAKYDMRLNTHLKSDIPGWLRTDGKKPVEAVIGGIKQDLDQFVKDVNTAQKAVDSLNAQIAKAKDGARRNAKSTESNLAAAQKKVDSLQSQIEKLDSGIEPSLKKEFGLLKDIEADVVKAITDKNIGHLTSKLNKVCNYKMKVAIVYVPDAYKNAKCAAEFTKLPAKIIAWGAQRESLVVAKAAADTTLSSLKSGIGKTDVADLDPKVISLEGELTIATGTLQAAKHLAQGAEQGDKLIDDALNKFAQGNLFVLKGSLIEGSLQKAIAGKPVVMGLKFEVAGEDNHLGFALSFTNLAFTLNQLDALALFVFSKVLESSAKGTDNVPPGLAKLVHEAYLVKAEAVAAELDKAMKDNGLE